MVKERVLRTLVAIRVGSIPTPRIFFEATSCRKNALEKRIPKREKRMEYIYSALSGISAKLYDDLTDNHLLEDPVSKEVLKGSQWILLTLISQADFNFALPFYLTAFANSISDTDAFVSPYERSLILLYPVLLLISLPTAKAFTSGDYLFASLTTLALLTEPFINSEEYSYRKLGTRIAAFIWTIIMIRFFTFSPSVLKAIYFFLGY